MQDDAKVVFELELVSIWHESRIATNLSGQRQVCTNVCVCVPESERHGVVAFLHFAEKCPWGLHFQPVLLARVSLVNGGPLSWVFSLDKEESVWVLRSSAGENVRDAGLWDELTHSLWPCPLLCWSAHPQHTLHAPQTQLSHDPSCTGSKDLK